MQVSLWNVALQTVNFVVLAWLLQRFLFKPVRAVLAKRQSAIEASLREADVKKKDAERLADEYRAKSATVASEAERAREAALAEAKGGARELREEAVRQAQAEIERARGDLRRERVEALHALEQRALDLATTVARRLLVDAAPESDEPFLERLTASVDKLDPARRAALGRQLGAAKVEIASCHALDARARARLEAWLAALANKPVDISYIQDESLIAGVEMRTPTGVWRAHWHESLDRIRAELEAHAAAA